MNNSENNKTKKSLGKKIFLYGLASLAVGLVSYFGFQFWKKNKEENGDANKAPDPVKQSQTPKPKTNPPKAKPGAAKTNPPPKSKTSNPSQNAASSDKSGPGSINAILIAAAIHAGILIKNFTAVFNQLKLIKSVSDYQAVNKIFQKTRVAGKPQTLVSGLLASFKSESQKTALRKAFTAMGLKYDGKKWSLSGLEGNQLLITTEATRVWLDPKNFVQVPINMVLGEEIAKRGEFSMFENEKRYFLVESKSVNYYNN